MPSVADDPKLRRFLSLEALINTLRRKKLYRIQDISNDISMREILDRIEIRHCLQKGLTLSRQMNISLKKDCPQRDSPLYKQCQSV